MIKDYARIIASASSDNIKKRKDKITPLSDVHERSYIPLVEL